MNRRIEWAPLRTLIAAGLEDLAVLHWEEVEIDRDDVPLALQTEAAIAAEKVGQHKTAGLWVDDDLVGYAAFTIQAAFFHRHTLHAFGHAIYVAPEHRGVNSLALLSWCEHQLAALGVVKIQFSSRTKRQYDLFKAMGYSASETVHTRILKHVRRRNSTDGIHAA